MRWEGQTTTHVDADALPGLEERGSVLEQWPTPGFDGASFLEITARSALNRVPGDGFMGGTWTINPYRGCQHACRYCFARNTHTYLDLDAGADFDSRIVVKANLVEVLERELAGPRRAVDAVQLGTNTDPYQRAEGRYRLMPGVLRALARHGASISILTKGTLLRRDLPLLASIARDVPVAIAMSIAIFDDELQQEVEPGTPTTAARLATVRAVRDAGLDCAVFAMPVLRASPTRTSTSTERSPRSPTRARRARSRARCTCGPAPASGTSRGCARRTRTCCRCTGASTGGAPTPRRAIATGCGRARGRSCGSIGSHRCARPPARGSLRRPRARRARRSCRRRRSRPARRCRSSDPAAAVARAAQRAAPASTNARMRSLHSGWSITRWPWPGSTACSAPSATSASATSS